jgi:hypothetical protein
MSFAISDLMVETFDRAVARYRATIKIFAVEFVSPPAPGARRFVEPRVSIQVSP